MNSNKTQSIYSYYTSDMKHIPKNSDQSVFLNFKPVTHYTTVDIIDTESKTLRKLDKQLNKCDNETSF
jgi:hypothetical protein